MSFPLAGKWLSILALPLVEVVLFMVFTGGSQPRGFRWTYLDLLLPVPTAFFVLMFLLETGAPCRLSFQKVALGVNVAALALAFGVHPWPPVVAVAVLSAFCVWVDPRYFLKNPNRAAILPCVLLAFSVALYTNLPKSWYDGIGTLTSKVTGGLVAAFFGNEMQSSMAGTTHLRLTLGTFVARVSKPCLGFDGFFYFTVVFLLLSALYRKGLRLVRWTGGFFLGLSMIFFLNVLRVVLLISVGAWAQNALGAEAGGQLLNSIVHPHLGWLLYTPGILLYMPWCLRMAHARDRFGVLFQGFLAELASCFAVINRKGQP